ncbi:hypothetical protein LguiB_028655 [Lonicera macranthoides]
MDGKLKNQIIYIDSSSSDSDSEINDPDFETRWFPRQVGNNGFLSIRKKQGIIIKEENIEAESMIRSSSRRKHGRLPRQSNSRNFNLGEKKINEIPKKARSKRQRVPTIRNKIARNENIIAWLIDTKVVKENEMVRYVDKNGLQPNKDGLITQRGIFCLCCCETFTAREFQFHGGRKIEGICDNIFLVEKGVYLSCLVDSDSYDDACIVCANGGNLMCCEDCPSTYHHTCVGWEVIEKFLKVLGTVHIVCASFVGIQLQREIIYRHVLNARKDVYEKMQRMVGEKIVVGGGYTWSLLRRIDEEDSYNMCVQNPNRRIECNSKLEIAWRVMQECFEPIVDRHTSIDVLQSVVYNRRSIFNRIDFSSFYTAVLEKDDEIVSVASVRIHRNKIAEMPFIATREMHRGNGFCSKLLTAIESEWPKINHDDFDDGDDIPVISLRGVSELNKVL